MPKTSPRAKGPQRAAKEKSVCTLAIDIGGTGIKMMVLDAAGKPLTERLRVPTPSPATPKRLLAEMVKMREQMPVFDRVSLGFPGVIKEGKTWTAANLDQKWVGFPFEEEIRKLWRKPVILCNDAAVQGFGAIQGKGLELVLTLGTGLGSALYSDGRLAPGLELAHHPWRKGKTYEDCLGRRGYERHGRKKWNELLMQAIDQTAKLFNWDRLYLGGGNSRKVTLALPKNVKLISNEEGLLGGVALWRGKS
jgi:polyphosphate glucokinase